MTDTDAFNRKKTVAGQTRCCSISRTSLSVLKMQKKRMRIFDTLSGGTDAAHIKQKQV